MIIIDKIGYWYFVSKKNIQLYLAEIFVFDYVQKFFWASLGLNLLMWILAAYFYLKYASDTIILHYNVMIAGADLVGDKYRIFTIPLFGLIFIIINYIILFFFRRHRDRKFISYLLLSAALFANIMLFAGLGSIYLINLIEN